MGYDLCAFSGGKAMRGPQCAGLLIGKKELVANAITGRMTADAMAIWSSYLRSLAACGDLADNREAGDWQCN